MLSRIVFIVSAVLFFLLGFKVITHDLFQWQMTAAGLIAAGLALVGVPWPRP